MHAGERKGVHQIHIDGDSGITLTRCVGQYFVARLQDKVTAEVGSSFMRLLTMWKHVCVSIVSPSYKKLFGSASELHFLEASSQASAETLPRVVGVMLLSSCTLL